MCIKHIKSLCLFAALYFSCCKIMPAFKALSFAQLIKNNYPKTNFPSFLWPFWKSSYVLLYLRTIVRKDLMTLRNTEAPLYFTNMSILGVLQLTFLHLTFYHLIVCHFKKYSYDPFSYDLLITIIWSSSPWASTGSFHPISLRIFDHINLFIKWFYSKNVW